jgi:hypothetical protein
MPVQIGVKRDGRDPFIRRSMMGEDPIEGWLEVGKYFVAYEQQKSNNEFHIQGEVDRDWHSIDAGYEPLDRYYNVDQMFKYAIDLSDKIHDEAVRDTTPSSQWYGHPVDEEEASIRCLEQLYAQASILLYTGSAISTISTVVVIMNMYTMHGTSNTFQEELLKYLSTCLLPTGNMLPTSFNQVRNMVRKLGHSYNVIPCCCKGCILYREEYEHLDHCPKCGTSRYVALHTMWMAPQQSMPRC